MEIGTLQTLVFEEYKENGYLEMWETPSLHGHPEWQKYFDLAEAGLVGTEAGELQEAVRDQDREAMATESADIIIRVLNFCSRLKLPIKVALVKKHKKNMKRGKLHGREI